MPNQYTKQPRRNHAKVVRLTDAELARLKELAHAYQIAEVDVLRMPLQITRPK